MTVVNQTVSLIESLYVTVIYITLKLAKGLKCILSEDVLYYFSPCHIQYNRV